MELNREKLISEIIERELAMFLATPNRGGISPCQQRPETFRFMRRMAHIGHENEFLASYLDDLKQAEKDGRNFMIEKYARMEGIIPALLDSPLPDEIASAETSFLKEAARTYPEMIQEGGLESFWVYLRSELETLSPKSLELYAAEIKKAQKENRNPVLERHEWLASYLKNSNNEY